MGCFSSGSRPFAQVALEDDATDAALSQFDGQRETHRSGADDQD
jgi:hypothetical protein